MGRIQTIKKEIEVTQDSVIKAQEELLKIQEKLRETEELLKLAGEERENLRLDLLKQINDLAESNNMFCGIILDTNNLLAVIQMAITSKENIKIPIQLYFNEE